ncbi:MAG: poly-gamma-glutamate system protein [Candidatus Saccharicenans sp.]
MRNTEFKSVILGGLAVISLCSFLAYKILTGKAGPPDPNFSLERQAAQSMLKAERATFNCQKRRGLQPEKNKFDPNGTGLIGLEQSPLTTTLGRLEAKRTTTIPDMAALVVRLLREAGVKPGDSVAVAASSSFPALILASLCAGQCLNLDLMLVVSLGASQWGANHPEFTILDMLECWRQAGLDKHRLLAVTWGGEDNSGQEFPEEIRAEIEIKAQKLGLKILQPGRLKEMVEEQMNLFLEKARGPVKAFVNIGGNLVCLGRDASILELKPGLTSVEKIPPPERRGLIQTMASRGIPVIHLLNIQELVTRYGLPWDPQPLPQPGASLAGRSQQQEKRQLTAVFLSYVLVGAIFVFSSCFIRKRRGQKEPQPDS